MTCREIHEKELLEECVAGSLSGEILEAVEEHYFGCDECARYLHKCRIAQAALRERADAIRLPAKRTQRWWPILAIAAALVLGAILIWQPPLRPTAPADYARIARVDPPLYEPLLLRGSEDRAGEPFRAAMQSYSRGDYAAAVSALRKVVKTNAEVAEAQFYLAAAQLLTGQSREAREGFTQVIRLGDRRFGEQSHFYLAKAWLQENHPEAARQELRSIAKGQSEIDIAARKLLVRLDELVKLENHAQRQK
jgi:tetratricopeptide (TPR) repeat protein